ncbi:MAG: OmpA family protein [Myxococcales bacterium]
MFAALLACAHAQPTAEATPPKPEPIAQPTPPPATEPVPAPPPAMPEVKPAEPAPVVEVPAARLYFAFDQSFLNEDARAALARLVDSASVPGARVRIEGNCDERGSVEYNIGLGQRRADAAKSYLVRLGVPEAGISTISYGEERPSLLGHDEESWRENRRDDVFVLPPAKVSVR